MTVVDAKAFWTKGFDADEARGITVRVGPWRCAPLNDGLHWGCLRDGAEYPHGTTFDARQEAVDFMVAEVRTATFNGLRDLLAPLEE